MLKKPAPFFILFLSVTWFACKKVDVNFGDQFLDNGYTQVVQVDSFAPDLTTVYVDSFITSSKGVSVIGSYTDPVFGKITSNNYFEVLPPSYIMNSTYADSLRSVSFDSIALILKPDKSYIGDTTKPLHVDVSRLAEAIAPFDLVNLYNTNTFAVQPTLVGSKDIVVRPNTNDSITLRLNDAFGKELLRKFQDPNDADLRTNDAFLQYMFGFRLSTSANSQLLFGCMDSVVMRMYYKKPGLFLESRTVDFTLANKGHHFNNITVDRSNSVLKNLPTLKQINSVSLNNTAYSMYAAGAMLKVRFPTVRDMLKLPNFAKILKATLVVRPIRGSYGYTSYALAPELRLSTTTQLNLIGNDIGTVAADGTAVTETGNLLIDDLYGENTYYSYDITGYIKTVIADGSINGNGLLIIPPTPALEAHFGRLIAGDHNNNNGKMELLIVYASVQ